MPRIIERFPHCDQRILHAPGVCHFCDKYTEWQELRKAWGIAFTGRDPRPRHERTLPGNTPVLPCPADYTRGEGHKQWGGNLPTLTKDLNHDSNCRCFYCRSMRP